MNERLSQQITFLLEADKLKRVLRRTPLTDASRPENSAEHSWHLVLAAIVLAERAPQPLDLLRVLEMLAVHDLVEIDAGDTFAYDHGHLGTKAERERAAADRLFPLLPPEQGARLRARWEEFEAHETAEAHFANALDRLQPLLQNACAGGGSWRDHEITRQQVLRRMDPIRTAIPDVWPRVLEIVEAFSAAGILREGISAAAQPGGQP
jgi:putative hydrolase of HD superfamily